jgi:hypothetical protein
MVEKTMFDKEGNLFFRVSSGLKNDTTFRDVTPEQSSTPKTKNLDLKIILKRTGFDSQMRPKVWYGLQDIHVHVPQEKALKYTYLVYIPKAMSNVCVVAFDPVKHDGGHNNIAYDLNLQPSQNSSEFGWVKKIGKPKTISPKMAQFMVENKEVFGVFTDSGELL